MTGASHAGPDPLGGQGDLPDRVRSLASSILRQFEAECGGDPEIHALAAASIAAEVYGHTPPTSELATGVDGGDDTSRRIDRARRRIVRDVGIDALPPHPGRHVESYSEGLDLPEETAERAMAIVDETYGARDVAPSTAAAAAVYTASLIRGDHVSQAEVARVADVSRTALKNEYRRQYDCVTGGPEGRAGD